MGTDEQSIWWRHVVCISSETYLNNPVRINQFKIIKSCHNNSYFACSEEFRQQITTSLCFHHNVIFVAADLMLQKCPLEVLQTMCGSQRKLWAQALLAMFIWDVTRYMCFDICWLVCLCSNWNVLALTLWPKFSRANGLIVVVCQRFT